MAMITSSHGYRTKRYDWHVNRQTFAQNLNSLTLLRTQSFKVHDIDEFTDVILPQFFEQTKYKSFQRQ
jgi:hypothetical protein